MSSGTFPLIRREQYSMVIAPPLFSLLSIIAVILRFTARRLAHRRPDSSDYTLLIALILSVAYSGLNMAECIIGGGGLHVSEIYALGGSMETFQKIGLAVQVLWSTTVTSVKISILLLYCKIFPLTWFVWSARFVGLMCIGYTLGTILAAFLVCQPLPYYWDTTVEGGHCGNEFLSYILTGSINITTDVMVLLLPIPSLLRLEMALYKKVVLIATFACGLFTCIVSGLRLQAIVMIDFNDYTYSIADAMTYSALEPALAIVLACVPTLRPLLPTRTRQNSTSVTGNGGTSLKWRLHPSLITFGGSRRPDMEAGSKPSRKDNMGLDDHLETGSECELTVRSVGTDSCAETTNPGIERQRSEDTMAGNTNDCLNGRDIEMVGWAESGHNWLDEPQRK
ncbi:unnamed protein product [Discula destructiva]